MLLTACKTLRRSPGLALAAIVCLALGTAATSAVGTLIAALLLRPLPFAQADRLVRVWLAEPGGESRLSLSIPEFEDFARVQAFAAFLGTARVRAVALLGHGAERLRGEGVSRGYFTELGLDAHAGRILVDADHRPDSAPVMVLSHAAWAQYFGADPSIIGRSLRTTRAVYTIVGVAQRGFHGTVEDDLVEFFLPIEQYEPRSLVSNRSGRSAWAIARLAPGVTLARANEETAAVGAALARAYPEVYRNYVARIEPLGESWRTGLRRAGALLFAAAAALLLVAALNVGCLLLARALDRRRELAIHAALGADKRRLTAQVSAEAIVVVFLGGSIGLLAGPSLLDAFLRFSPVTLPHYVALTPSAWSLVLPLCVLAVAAAVTAVIPSLVSRRVEAGDVLREGARGSLGRRTEQRWTRALIVAETALTLVLLVSGGLLLRSFDQLGAAPLGFSRTGIARLAVTVSPTDAGSADQLPAVYERLRQHLAGHPGVDAVGLVSPTLPPWDGERGRIRLPGTDAVPDEGVLVGTHLADHGLLPMLGVRLLAGRNLAPTDGAASARVAVVSASVARLLGGPERALGHSLRFAPNGPRPSDVDYVIVGVADDIAYDGVVEQETRRYLDLGNHVGVRTARFDVYFALAQAPTPVVSIGVATSGDARALIPSIRRALGLVLPASAVHWTSAMDEEIALEYAPSRFYSVLVALFSLSALLLTSVGLFALLAHAATQRTSEMALRIAVGATPVTTTWLLLRGGLAPVAMGIAAGLGGTVWASRVVRGMLYGIEAFDLATIAAAVLLLLAVALVAGAIPAHRAARRDPITVLRGN
jgi:putative ABC transport system permease protein